MEKTENFEMNLYLFLLPKIKLDLIMSAFLDHKIKTNSCSNHPKMIFGQNMAEIRKEWLSEDLKPRYGCVCMDCIVLAWMDFVNPVKELKKEGVYDLFSSLVNKNTFSGVLYRGTDYNITGNVGDVINYSNRLTSWSTEEEVALDFTTEENPIILKLSCKDVVGLPIYYSRDEKEVVLGECILKIVDKKVVRGKVVLEVVVEN